jgi:hypothetical protein
MLVHFNIFNYYGERRKKILRGNQIFSEGWGIDDGDGDYLWWGIE